MIGIVVFYFYSTKGLYRSLVNCVCGDVAIYGGNSSVSFLWDFLTFLENQFVCFPR